MGQDVAATDGDMTEQVSRDLPQLGGYVPPPQLAAIIEQWAWSRGYISMYEVLGWLKAEYTRGYEEGRKSRR